MEKIKVRITPYLKMLGFGHQEGSLWYRYNEEGQETHNARVHKSGGDTRYLEIFGTKYDWTGSVSQRYTVVKNLPLDLEDTPKNVVFIEHALLDLATEFGKVTDVSINMSYWLGKTEERVG